MIGSGQTVVTVPGVLRWPDDALNTDQNNNRPAAGATVESPVFSLWEEIGGPPGDTRPAEGAFIVDGFVRTDGNRNVIFRAYTYTSPVLSPPVTVAVFHAAAQNGGVPCLIRRLRIPGLAFDIRVEPTPISGAEVVFDLDFTIRTS